MRERSYRFSEKQAEEHRLEIENRIRNLFWTISGDYTLDVKPDVKAFVRSGSAVLYDAMKQDWPSPVWMPQFIQGLQRSVRGQWTFEKAPLKLC